MLVVDHTCVLVELSNDVMPNGWRQDPGRNVELRVLWELDISVGKKALRGTGENSRNDKHQDHQSIELELMHMIMKWGIVYNANTSPVFAPDIISLKQFVLLLLGDAKEIEQVLHALSVQPSRCC